MLPRIIPLVLIQEPNVFDNKVTGIPGKLILSQGFTPRTAIITLRNVNIALVSQYSSPDCSVARLFLARSSLTIVSFYHDINIDNFPTDIFGAMELDRDYIISGDTNAHSTLWGSPDNGVVAERRGKKGVKQRREQKA